MGNIQRIMDANVAEESASLLRLQITQEFSVAMLSQVNAEGMIALDLLSTKEK